MSNHWRDRKFAQNMRIGQSLEDPSYRKLSGMDHQLNLRTHRPLYLVKPDLLSSEICNRICHRIDSRFVVSNSKREQQIGELQVLQTPEMGRVDKHLDKFKAQCHKMWKSAVSFLHL